MERIIGTFLYSTETSTKLLSAKDGNMVETLYVTPNGRYFLLRDIHKNGSLDSYIIPQNPPDAANWLQALNSDEATAIQKQYFKYEEA